MKQKASRIEFSTKNYLASVAGQILVAIFGFVTRSVFIEVLGPQYLGINGLFSNIISVLALTELGFGTAIVFHLYRPIAENDEELIYVLMKFYKFAYRLIGIAITVLGLFLMFFLNYFIKSPPNFINIYFVYLLFLMQSVSSYFFFAYKSSLLRANQRAYIIAIIGYVFTILTNVLQIAVLLIFRKYELNLIILILTNIAKNIVVARKSDKMFPYINVKSDNHLSKNKQKEIIKDCFAISIYKINGVVVTTTDSLVLSKFIGLSIVGLYSNYTMILLMLKSFLNMIFDSMTPSLGNLHAENDIEKEYSIFKTINFIAFFSFGVVAIAFFVVVNPFITLWIGEEYTLSPLFVSLLSAELYIRGILRCNTTFRTSMGLFQQAKFRPIASAVVNIVMSLILVKPFGIVGVIFGTILSDLLTYAVVDPIIICRRGFKRSPRRYYLINLLYISITGIMGFVVYYISCFIPGTGILHLLYISIISIIIPIFIISIIFRSTAEFKYMSTQIKSNYMRINNKILKNKNAGL